MAQSVADVFVADEIVGLLNSLLNKKTALAFGAAGSRRVVIGFVARLTEEKENLRAQSPWCAPQWTLWRLTRRDRFHVDESTTQASAEDKIRFTKGYLCIQSDEAGTLLSRAAAEGKEANRSVHLDWRHWTPEAGVCIDPTNVHMLFFRQELLWDTFWAQSLQCNDIGLVQRFLFSFGVYGDPVPSKWFSFYEGFTVPLVRRLFEAMLLACGPACAPRVFTTTPAQNTVIQELERTQTNFKRKVSVAGGLQGALPRAMYWIANGAMTNHILKHLLPPVLAEPPLSGKPLEVPRLPDEISDAAFVTAQTFAVRRYLFGQAVLAKSAEEQSWLGKDVPIARPMAGDEELIVRLLRGATGACVRGGCRPRHRTRATQGRSSGAERSAQTT